MIRREFLATGALATIAAATGVRADDRKLRVAVMGHTGRGDYGHGLDKMWLKVPETEIVAVADADPKGLEAAKKRISAPADFADYREMLTKTKPDIVAICPRHIDQHHDMALAAIDAGARGIYMEKPFCRTPAEADALVAACEKNKTKLALAHRNRFHPALQTVERALKADVIGKLLEIRGRGKEDQRGGVLDLWVLGSHVLNLGCYFAGKPVACSGVLLQDGRPVTRADMKDGPEGVGPIGGNQLHARYEMENGVPFFFDSIAKAGTAAVNFGLQLIGTKGIIDIRVDVEPIAHLLPGNPFQTKGEPRAWTPISSADVGKPEPIENLGELASSHVLAARDLITALKDDRPPACDAQQGRTTVEMICAVFESHRQNGQRVPWPLQTRTNALSQM